MTDEVVKVRSIRTVAIQTFAPPILAALVALRFAPWWGIVLIAAAVTPISFFIARHRLYEATIGPGDLLTIRSMVAKRSFHLEDLRRIEKIQYRSSSGPSNLSYRFVFIDSSFDLGELFGGSLSQRLKKLNPSLVIVEPGATTPPDYDIIGWRQVLAAAQELSPAKRAWIEKDLASRQDPGRLLAAVVGDRVRHSGLTIEPAALLVYSDLIVATSGYGIGETAYLRPGHDHVLDLVVHDEDLLEVTASGIHIVDLRLVSDRGPVLQSLHSLPWLQVREAPLDQGC